MIRSYATAALLVVSLKISVSAQWRATAIAPTTPINRIAVLGTHVLAGYMARENDHAFIYISADEGVTAKQDTNQFQNFLQPVGAIVFRGGANPSSDNVFLSKSTDNGASWSDFAGTQVQITGGSNMSVSASTCMSMAGKTILVGWMNGIVRSTDDGVTWAASNTGLTTGSAAPLGVVGNLVRNGSTVFAGTSGAGMFTSQDDGASWKHATNGPISGNITALGSAGTKVYAGTQGLGLYVTADAGVTWTSVNMGAGPIDKFIQAIVSAGGNLFVSTAGSVQQSADGGATWNSIGAGLPPGAVTALAANGNTLFAGTPKGVWSRALTDFPSLIRPATHGFERKVQNRSESHGGLFILDLGDQFPSVFDLRGKLVH